MNLIGDQLDASFQVGKWGRWAAWSRSEEQREIVSRRTDARLQGRWRNPGTWCQVGVVWTGWKPGGEPNPVGDNVILFGDPVKKDEEWRGHAVVEQSVRCKLQLLGPDGTQNLLVSTKHLANLLRTPHMKWYRKSLRVYCVDQGVFEWGLNGLKAFRIRNSQLKDFLNHFQSPLKSRCSPKRTKQTAFVHCSAGFHALDSIIPLSTDCLSFNQGSIQLLAKLAPPSHLPTRSPNRRTVWYF
jgi:hypothetical protein